LFKKIVEKIEVLLKSDKNNGTLHAAHYTFLIIPRSVPLKEKCCKLYRKSKHTF